MTQRVRVRCEALGIPAGHVAVFATHSHTGPLYYGVLRDYFREQTRKRHGRDIQELADYATLLQDRLVHVISAAKERSTVCELAAGKAIQTPTLSFNRRFHMKSGPVRFNPGPLNPEIVRPAGPIDPEVGFVAVRDTSGSLQGVLTVFALHLDTLGGTHYSADFPFYLERDLRRVHGHRLISLFGAGTCGDINHIDVTTRERRSTEAIGTALAKTVLEAIPKLATIKPPKLAARHVVVEVPLQQYGPAEIERARQAFAKVGTNELGFLDQVEAVKIVSLQSRPQGFARLDVQVVRLGPDLALVALPGEVFVDIGLAIKRASPFANTFVIELANESLGYIPTAKAFREGSYETVNSIVRPGGSEMLMSAAIRLLRELESRN